MIPFEFSSKNVAFIVILLTIFLVNNVMAEISAINNTDLPTQHPNNQTTEFGGETENPTKKRLVIILANETFYSHVANGSHFVLFYGPRCGHTKKFIPTWEKLAESPKFEDVSFSKLDCEGSRAICKEFEIRGYPTLVWIEDGRNVEKYGGRRTEKELTRYVEMMSQQDFTSLDEKEGDGSQAS